MLDSTKRQQHHNIQVEILDLSEGTSVLVLAMKLKSKIKFYDSLAIFAKNEEAVFYFATSGSAFKFCEYCSIFPPTLSVPSI